MMFHSMVTMAKRSDASPEKPKGPPDLQDLVLQHLKEHGPTMWNALYASFDQEKIGDIETVLQGLKKWKYLTVGPTDRVKITARGLAQLKRAQ